jgi:hypothetical protein
MLFDHLIVKLFHYLIRKLYVCYLNREKVKEDRKYIKEENKYITYIIYKYIT